MNRDYKSNPRYVPPSQRPPTHGNNGKGGGGTQSKTLLVAGIVVGALAGVVIAIAVAFMVMRSKSPFTDKTKAAASTPADPKVAQADLQGSPSTPPAASAGGTTPPATPNGDNKVARIEDQLAKQDPSKPKFDFYNILPGNADAVPAGQTPQQGTANPTPPAPVNNKAPEPPKATDNKNTTGDPLGKLINDLNNKPANSDNKTAAIKPLNADNAPAKPVENTAAANNANKMAAIKPLDASTLNEPVPNESSKAPEVVTKVKKPEPPKAVDTPHNRNANKTDTPKTEPAHPTPVKTVETNKTEVNHAPAIKPSKEVPAKPSKPEIKAPEAPKIAEVAKVEKPSKPEAIKTDNKPVTEKTNSTKADTAKTAKADSAPKADSVKPEPPTKQPSVNEKTAKTDVKTTAVPEKNGKTDSTNNNKPTDNKLAKLDPKATETSKPTEKPTETKQRFLLQVGAFQSADNADNLKAKLAIAGMDASVSEIHGNSGTRHLVRVGPFNSPEEMERARAALKQNGFNGAPIKLGK